MPTRRQFVTSLPAAGAAFALADHLLLEAPPARAQQIDPLQGHFHAKGKAPSKFKAYESRPEGLDDFIRLLYEPRYAPMLKAARANDTQGFADAVHTTGYCPDDACRGSNTLATYRRLKNNFAPLLGLPLEGNGPAGPILLVLLLFALAKGLRR